jgi:hypothetical protein
MELACPHEVGSIQQRIRRATVKPPAAAAQTLDMQLPAIEVRTVDVSDF